MKSQDFGNYSVARKDFKTSYYSLYKEILTPQEFNKKVKNYCLHHGIKLREKKTHGIVRFFFNE